jgi:uncharacterized protein DUF3887
MKRGRAWLVTVLAAVMLIAGCGREGNPSAASRVEDPAIVSSARQAVRDMVDGRYAELRRSFDQQMLKELPAPRIALAWSAFVSLMGAFRSQGDAAVYLRGGFRIVNVEMHMTKGDAQARVTYGPTGKIAGLYLLQPGITVSP